MSDCFSKCNNSAVLVEQVIDALNAQATPQHAHTTTPIQRLLDSSVLQPPGLRLRVRFTSGTRVEPPAGSKEGKQHPTSAFSADELQALREAEESMLTWLNAHPDNAIQFALEPVEALYLAAPELPKDLLRRLGRRHAERHGSNPSTKVRLDEVQIDVEEANCAAT